MRNLLLIASILALTLTGVSPALAGGVDADAAFDQLKSLSGTWRGQPTGEGAEAEAEAAETGEVVHEFRVSAGGTVVMETMSPGMPHEMINMYHLDGEDLVLTHYCAGGNQPVMRLDRDRSTPDKLVFDFAGGTGLDPAIDEHIHAAEITVLDDDRVDSLWKAHVGGEEVAVMTFHLARAK